MKIVKEYFVRAMDIWASPNRIVTLKIAKNWRFLAIYADGQENECIEIFAEIDTTEPVIEQPIYVVYAEEQLPTGLGRYLGTVKLGPSMTYHVYLGGMT
jgi:hypothetical protein